MRATIFLLIVAVFSLAYASNHHRNTYRHDCPDEEHDSKTHNGEKVYKAPCSSHHGHKHHHHAKRSEVQDPIIRFGRSIQEDAYPKDISPKFQVLKKILT